MDTSDSYEDLDLALGEPGVVVDNRGDEEAAVASAEVADPAFMAAVAAFELRRKADRPAVCCMVRVNLPGDGAAGDGIHARLGKAVQHPDFCHRTGPAEFALALDGCDASTARRRLNLMIRLIQMDEAFVAGTPSIWAGVAPIDASGTAQGMRTARLACDLASFQDSGHVEVVEL